MTATTKKPQVPETLLKKRKENKVRKERVQTKAANQRKVRTQKRKLIFKRAQAYVKEYRSLEKQNRGLLKVAAKYDNFYIPAEPKIVYVMRIRGINNIHPRPRKIMQLLRLRQINNGIFLRLNKATSNMLKLAEPYITWGIPNLKTVRDLIYKRGFGKIKGSRIPLTDNALIENVLGKYNIVCMEDLIHEIYTCGPRFREVSNFLWPFKLSNPTGGWRKKLNHYNDGGDYGNRELDLNKLLRKMI